MKILYKFGYDRHRMEYCMYIYILYTHSNRQYLGVSEKGVYGITLNGPFD